MAVVTSLFVIPCKYDPTRPVIFDCVARIHQHHPTARIMVVDSCSEDRSYLDNIEVDHIRLGNRHCMNGAFTHGIDAEADVYHFIADSVMVNQPLPHPDPLVCFRWFSNPPHQWGWDRDGINLVVWGAAQLDKIGLPTPDSYRGVQGPMFSALPSVVEDLRRIGYWTLLPDDMWQQCAMERVTGIVLEHLGYDVTVSLQGEHRGHFDEYPDTYITKLNLGRI